MTEIANSTMMSYSAAFILGDIGGLTILLFVGMLIGIALAWKYNAFKKIFYGGIFTFVGGGGLATLYTIADMGAQGIADDNPWILWLFGFIIVSYVVGHFTEGIFSDKPKRER